MRPVLILFDIDGTLLITHGATTRSIWAAAERTFGRTLPRSPLTPGRLDQQLFADVAAACDIPDAARYFDSYKRNYLAEIEAELARHVNQIRVLPGVTDLLTALERRPDAVYGLLTGNFRETALTKIRLAGLDRFPFEISAFAQDGAERPDLVAAARERYQQRFGAAPPRIIVLGDTPRDIETARKTGCKVLAVATGVYTIPQLQAEHPDAVVADLTDTRPLYEMIDAAA